MSAQINKNGQLMLVRKGRPIHAYCLFNVEEHCTHYCAAFDDSNDMVRICTGQIFDIIADERAESNDVPVV